MVTRGSDQLGAAGSINGGHGLQVVYTVLFVAELMLRVFAKGTCLGQQVLTSFEGGNAPLRFLWASSCDE